MKGNRTTTNPVDVVQLLLFFSVLFSLLPSLLFLLLRALIASNIVRKNPTIGNFRLFLSLQTSNLLFPLFSVVLFFSFFLSQFICFLPCSVYSTRFSPLIFDMCKDEGEVIMDLAWPRTNRTKSNNFVVISVLSSPFVQPCSWLSHLFLAENDTSMSCVMINLSVIFQFSSTLIHSRLLVCCCRGS